MHRKAAALKRISGRRTPQNATCSVVCLHPQVYSNKFSIAALVAIQFHAVLCLSAQRKGMVIYMNKDKGLSTIDVLTYKLKPQEQIAAGLIKSYLQSFPEPVAKKLLAQVVNPKVIELPRNEQGMVCHSGKATPMQTTIDGAQLAALIDLAAGNVTDMLEEEWLVSGEANVKEAVLEGIAGICGEEIVSHISWNMAQFMVDCCMMM